jgi:hypothetical protein
MLKLSEKNMRLLKLYHNMTYMLVTSKYLIGINDKS